MSFAHLAEGIYLTVYVKDRLCSDLLQFRPIIQPNSLQSFLFISSPEANYKVNRNKRLKERHKKNAKGGNLYQTDNTNSVQFFIIYVPSQQPQGQLQTELRVHTSNYIMNKHYIKSETNYKQALEENTIMQRSKQTNKQ
jgi:hypothetical protein